MFNKSELRALWARYNFTPRKAFGQNFLIDKNIRDKIVSSVSPAKGDSVVEIGPGFGELTFCLAKKAGAVRAVEKDKKIFEIFNNEFGKTENLEFVNDDILNADLSKFSQDKRIIVVGNLPYYITTPILEMLIESRRLIKDVFITVQKEVADRIVARPGTKDYSSLSVFLQFYTSPETLFTIRRRCFYPEPEVDSKFLRLEILARPSVTVKDEEIFFKVVRKAFQQRRKTILNSLSHRNALGMDKAAVESLLVKTGIKPSIRPDDIPVETFARIANNISVVA